MYAQLYEYLLQYQELPVPGIGTFFWERKPAEIDFINKLAIGPAFSFGFRQENPPPSRRFYGRLAGLLKISERDAIIGFNDFAFEMKNHIGAGDEIHWQGLGVIRKSSEGAIEFVPRPALRLSPVPANKVLREKAEHRIRVGEEERTSSQMTELLGLSSPKRTYWWAPALVIAILSVIFIGWYFSEHGFSGSGTANTHRLVPEQPGPTYRMVP